MKKRFALAAIVLATPAHAHHEVVAAASILPLASAVAAITAAGATAWWQSRKRKKTGDVRNGSKKLQAEQKPPK